MIDTNDSEFLSRVEGADLKAKICDAKTAAAMIQPGDILGISGFTPCGYPKITTIRAIPSASSPTSMAANSQTASRN